MPCQHQDRLLSLVLTAGPRQPSLPDDDQRPLLRPGFEPPSLPAAPQPLHHHHRRCHGYRQRWSCRHRPLALPPPTGDVQGTFSTGLVRCQRVYPPSLLLFSHPLAAQCMNGHGVDAFIVPSEDPHMSEYAPECDARRQYISGFTGSAGTVVVTKDKALLWTDGRYFLQARGRALCAYVGGDGGWCNPSCPVRVRGFGDKAVRSTIRAPLIVGDSCRPSRSWDPIGPSCGLAHPDARRSPSGWRPTWRRGPRRAALRGSGMETGGCRRPPWRQALLPLPAALVATEQALSSPVGGDRPLPSHAGGGSASQVGAGGRGSAPRAPGSRRQPD